jgi:tellurite resistance protein TerA
VNQSIRPGENTTIASPRGSVTISHATAPNLDVNLTAFLIADNGKVVDDDGMVFYNAPRHASGAAVFESPRASGGSLSHSIQFDLGRLPTGIVKIAIALTEDGASPGFASMRNLQAQVQAGDDLLQLSPGGFSAEKASSCSNCTSGMASARHGRSGRALLRAFRGCAATMA